MAKKQTEEVVEEAKPVGYSLLVGVDYHPYGDAANEPVRHEIGEVVDDLPARVIKPWLEQGYIVVYVEAEAETTEV